MHQINYPNHTAIIHLVNGFKHCGCNDSGTTGIGHRQRNREVTDELGRVAQTPLRFPQWCQLLSIRVCARVVLYCTWRDEVYDEGMR